LIWLSFVLPLPLPLPRFRLCRCGQLFGFVNFSLDGHGKLYFTLFAAKAAELKNKS